MTPINGHLIYNNNTSSTPRTQATDYYTASYTYGQQQQYPSQAYTDMLLEETEKLYNKLAKESVDEIIGDCLFSPASSLLPLLSQPVERLQLIRPICIQKNLDILNQKWMTTKQISFYGLEVT
jgi:hypothetical protein